MLTQFEMAQLDLEITLIPCQFYMRQSLIFFGKGCMCQVEKRSGDEEPKKYLNAGLDFLNTAKDLGWQFPIYVYSSYVRISPELMHSCKEAGAEKICTYKDMVFMIEEGDDEKPEEDDDSECDDDDDDK